ncbi:MarR family transcriptional regulator [Nocardia sp. CA2R105]|uniref:MarR family winged helix-turn-helix transcriptional regulator n=1 Tax=Nocardia coffeae TaxID=2873381 RepID=UPI001CA6650A|nr:MarR family transcriptional regulator [Nocardia coffeae]MBY8863309.1 MarR family transcriptional regulator [Nocardia coffeae]
MIQQHSAERLAEAADAYLAVGRITRLLRRAGDTGALSPGSAAALGTLVRCGPMRLGDLAAAERVTAPTMSRIITQLEKGGYVQRAPDPIDGRAHVLSATGPAQDMVNGLTSARIQRFADVLDHLHDDERRILATTLTRIVDLLDE